MPRACVIVLDAVGAGELPDAADYGDEGSNTLANVAEAVGGLDLPNLEQLGLGNIEELAGCPPQPHAPAVAGRLFERSKGKDTTDRATGSSWASSRPSRCRPSRTAFRSR
jgi:phosphopentomutase